MKKKTVPTLALIVLAGMYPAANAEASCSYNPVTLHLDTNKIDVTPRKSKCLLSVPGEFTITVASGGSPVDPGVGDIVVREKSSSGLQIRGENDPNPDEVLVKVTGTAAGGSDHGYFIEIDGHGMLDPEVRIVTRAMVFEAAKTLLEEELGLSPEEFEELLRESREQQME